MSPPTRSADLEDMSIDQLDAIKLDLKTQIQALQEEYNRVNSFRVPKVAKMHMAEAKAQLARVAGEEGKDINATAREWLSSDQEGRRAQARLFLTGTTKET